MTPPTKRKVAMKEKKRKKTLIAWLLKSEPIDEVFGWNDEFLAISDDIVPCRCRGNLWEHEKLGAKKVRITIEEV